MDNNEEYNRLLKELEYHRSNLIKIDIRLREIDSQVKTKHA